MSHVVFYACPVRMVSKFLSPLRQAWHTYMIRVAYVKECMHLCRQADILLAWGGLCRLPFSKGKGWLDAPESKCPHAAPRPVILGEGLKEGGLFPPVLSLQRPRHPLTGGQAPPPLPACLWPPSKVPVCHLPELCPTFPTVHPSAERLQTDLERDLVRLNCLSLESPHVLIPRKKPVRNGHFLF